MTYDPENIFAKILRGEIPCSKVYENDHALAFEDINPLAPVHILIIPKGAYVSSADFTNQATDPEIAGFMRACGEVATRKGLDATGYRMLSNHGVDAHQDVPHYHVHVIGGCDLGGMMKKATSANR